MRRKPKHNGPLDQVKQYIIYYGALNSSVMAGLKQVDMAIVDPHHFSVEQVQELQAAGTSLWGYISVMEWPSWNVTREKALQDTDFLRLHGSRRHFPTWDSYLMDLRQAHYREVLLEEIKNQLVDKSFHGVFLDTVGDIDDYMDDYLLSSEMIESYLKLLSEIQSQSPQLGRLQNRGFEFLDQTAPYLDGFLWEGWQEDQTDHVWVQHQLKKLTKWRKAGLKLFSVSCEPQANDGKKAKRHGFIHLTRYKGYTEW
jgi:hypothetical protein